MTPYIRKKRPPQFDYRAFLPRQESQISYPAYLCNNSKTEAFHDASGVKIRAIFGGDRSGKSEAGGFELVRMARDFPGHTFWACAMTYPKLKINAEKIFKYLAEEEIEEIAWANRALRIPALIRHINGSKIEFKTYNSGVGSFASDSCKGIWLDEDPQRAVPNGEEIFVECQQRTIDCQGSIWITATPVLGKNWMYDRIYQKSIQSNQNVKSWTVSLLENRFIPEAEKERAKELLTADEIERRFYGLFTTLEGAVFKELRPDLHFIPRFQIPVNWRKVRSIDLGFVNAFCCLWGALSPDNTLYVYLEHYQNETLLQDHADIIQRLERDESLYSHVLDYGMVGLIEDSICDHDRQERAELEQHGIYTTPANKDVRHSIEIINRLMKPSPTYDGAQKPRLYIFNDCENLTKETQNYRWNPKALNGKEEPIKVDDHSVDALRYLCMYFFQHEADDSTVEIVERSARY